MKIENRCYLTASNFRYWTYYLIGGVYMSEEFKIRDRCWWFVLNFLILSVIVLGGVGYVKTAESLDPWNLTSSLWVPCGAVFSILVLPFITSSRSDDFQKLFNYIDVNSNRVNIHRNEEACLQLLIKRTEPHAEALSWFKQIACTSILFFLMPVIDIVLFTSDKYNAIRDVQHHLFGIPLMDHISSEVIFWTLYLTEILLVLFIMILVFSEPMFIITIAYELHNIVVDYCRDLRVLMSNPITSSIETNGHVSKKCMKLLEDFETNSKLLIRRYQELMEAIQFMRPYVQIYSSATLFIVFFVLCSNILLFLMVDVEIFLKLKLLAASALCPLYLYPHCQFGTIFNTVNEAVVQQIYNLPWYYMSPSRRKTVQIFLNQTQRPITFKAFGMYSINFMLIPNVFRLAYSFVNVLGATLQKDHK